MNNVLCTDYTLKPILLSLNLSLYKEDKKRKAAEKNTNIVLSIIIKCN